MCTCGVLLAHLTFRIREHVECYKQAGRQAGTFQTRSSDSEDWFKDRLPSSSSSPVPSFSWFQIRKSHQSYSCMSTSTKPRLTDKTLTVWQAGRQQGGSSCSVRRPVQQQPPRDHRRQRARRWGGCLRRNYYYLNANSVLMDRR